MTKATAAITLWTPRLAAIALALFLALFALDAFSGTPFRDGLAGFAIHLAPSLLVLAAVAISWRYPLTGAAAFALFALAYAVVARGRLDWVAVISGPLALVAALFFVSWLLTPRSALSA